MVYFRDTWLDLGFNRNIYLAMFCLKADLVILFLSEQLDFVFPTRPSVLCSRCLTQGLAPVGAP